MSRGAEINSAASHHLVFAGLILLAAAVIRQPLMMLLGSALVQDSHFTSLMVLPISVGLLWSERRSIFRTLQYSTHFGILLAILLAGLLGLGVGSSSLDQETSLSLSIGLFCAWSLAAFIYCYGVPACGRARFPLLLLFLMVPLPEALRAYLVRQLQYGSAEVTSWLFQLANVPFSRDGIILTLPRVTIEIAQECSGIRSSLALLVTTVVVARIFLKSAWSRAALVAFVVPITIAKNGLRIFVLAMLGMYVNPGFLTGRLHHNGGIVFFLVAFASIWGIVVFLQKIERRQLLLSQQASAIAPSPSKTLL
jgi:exosortase